MKRFLRILKRILVALLVIAVLGVIAYLIIDKPLPKGRPGLEAEQLTDKMLAAVNIQAWDTLAILSWYSPRSGRAYHWDRKRDFVHINRAGHPVLVQPSSGIGHVPAGTPLSGMTSEEYLKQELHHFWNDSFWFIAYTKVRDPGTVRQVVDPIDIGLDDGGKGLLVTYTQGGETPGDSYLWLLDAQGRPTSWRLWTQRLPIGGVEFSWAEWDSLPGGAMFSVSHASAVFEVRQENVEGGSSLAALGLPANMFSELEEVLAKQK